MGGGGVLSSRPRDLSELLTCLLAYLLAAATAVALLLPRRMPYCCYPATAAATAAATAGAGGGCSHCCCCHRCCSHVNRHRDTWQPQGEVAGVDGGGGFFRQVSASHGACGFPAEGVGVVVKLLQARGLSASELLEVAHAHPQLSHDLSSQQGGEY